MQKIATMLAVLFLFTALDARADLISNASFETTSPAVAPGTFNLYPAGNTTGVPGWTIVGPGANVGVVSTTFSQSGLHFVSEDGNNWVDLTGLDINSTEGVSQAIATTIGDSYTLTFWVGNVDSPTTGFGVTSTVHVLANGASLGSFTNNCTTCTTTQQWEMFTTTFTATSSSTTLAFLNADPGSDNDNGLDNVSLVDNGPATTAPEPSSVALLGSGLFGLFALVRRPRP